jgi:hypothetical protein
MHAKADCQSGRGPGKRLKVLDREGDLEEIDTASKPTFPDPGFVYWDTAKDKLAAGSGHAR